MNVNDNTGAIAVSRAVRQSAAFVLIAGLSLCTVGCNIFGGSTVVNTGFGDFNRKTILTGNGANANFTQPAYICFGPDGKLYVSTYTGALFAVTINEFHDVVDVQSSTPFAGRMIAGMAFDRWASPSSPQLYAVSNPAPIYENQDFTGRVSRLTGPGFTNVQDLIVGLPRSYENHMTFALAFGNDRLLYIGQGGNTNYGAPAPGVFGNRPERPLSAAILQADVRDPMFAGAADVEVYAPGMRNPYGLCLHSNGHMYVEDQGGNAGLGDLPNPSGTGTIPLNENRPDKLHVLRPGHYYGHPNPARGQLEFETDLADATPYSPALTFFPISSVVTGICEYISPANDGLLLGHLLLPGFGLGQDLHYVGLSADGLSVTDQGILTDAFDNPIDVTVGPDGTIYVLESGASFGFGGSGPSKITVLEPINPAIGAWGSQADLLSPRVDHAVVALDGKVYVIGGTTPSGNTGTMQVYDPATGVWSSLAAKPGTPVNHIGAAALNGKIYVFGGMESWPGPAINNVWIYDVATNNWSAGAPMPKARGAMGVEVVNGQIYLFGGLNNVAMADVAVYNPINDMWTDLTPTAPMPTARDHLTATLAPNGLVYCIGGRQVSVASVFGSVQAYDPQENRWIIGYAPLPTPRGGHAAALMHGRIVVVGGEGSSSATGTFEQVEEYDPVSNTWRTLAEMPDEGRHSTGAVNVNNVMYVPGGGPISGASSSANNFSFTFLP